MTDQLAWYSVSPYGELLHDRLQREHWNALNEARPSFQLRPRLSIDGDRWCALYGDNLQDGVAGFGLSPAEAYDSFDSAWIQKLVPAETASKPDGFLDYGQHEGCNYLGLVGQVCNKCGKLVPVKTTVQKLQGEAK